MPPRWLDSQNQRLLQLVEQCTQANGVIDWVRVAKALKRKGTNVAACKQHWRSITGRNDASKAKVEAKRIKSKSKTRYDQSSVFAGFKTAVWPVIQKAHPQFDFGEMNAFIGQAWRALSTQEKETASSPPRPPPLRPPR